MVHHPHRSLSGCFLNRVHSEPKSLLTTTVGDIKHVLRCVPLHNIPLFCLNNYINTIIEDSQGSQNCIINHLFKHFQRSWRLIIPTELYVSLLGIYLRNTLCDKTIRKAFVFCVFCLFTEGTKLIKLMLPCCSQLGDFFSQLNFEISRFKYISHAADTSHMKKDFQKLFLFSHKNFFKFISGTISKRSM